MAKTLRRKYRSSLNSPGSTASSHLRPHQRVHRLERAGRQGNGTHGPGGGGVDFEVRGPGSGVPDAELRSILDEARGASGSDLASWHAAGLAPITGSELVRGHGAELQVETQDDRDRSYRFSLASH
jgi:hypothetical protein